MTISDRKNLSRRDFVKATMAFVSGLLGITIGLPAIAYLLSPSLRKTEYDSTVDLGAFENYATGIPSRVHFTHTQINGWERTGTNYGLYVVRMNEKEARVFSDVCTHLGCRVTWHPDQRHYISPCHNGHFDILGNVVSGPPPRPLDEYITKIENGKLFATIPPVKRNT